MGPDRNSLFEKICAEDEECGILLEGNDITTNEDIQSLCYEALKEIIPGGGRKILQRSKLWKIIQLSLNSEQQSTCSDSPGSSIKNIKMSPEHHQNSPPVEDEPVHPINNTISFSTGRPTYTIYCDADVLAGAKAGKISSKVRNSIVRGTIYNMSSAASYPPFNRLPTSVELEEMSKSLVIKYSCLRDVENSHGVLFNQLKRRLSNIQPVKKRRGPNPKKTKYHDEPSKKEEIPKVISLEKDIDNKIKKEDESCILSNSKFLYCYNFVCADCDGDDGKLSDDLEIMVRHYQAIEKEMDKKKPNGDVINSCLNKEFQARREWLKMVPASERCNELLDAYPCFKDHVEVIEEGRRVLLVDEGDRHAFINGCVDRLVAEIELLIYFGISTKGIGPPKSPKLSTKVTHVLKNLSKIFARETNANKAVELVHELQDHEDPCTWSAKHMGNVPVLVLDTNSVYVIVGKRILFQTEVRYFKEATVGFLASFYLLDLNYPKENEIGMNMLQYFVFNDTNTPQDIAVPFRRMLKAYKNYKIGI